MLKLENIRKTFHAGTVNQKIALDGLSLTLNDGDFVTVIGGNGAGKSTLLNTIAGTFPVDSGSITIDGEDITDLPEQKRAWQRIAANAAVFGGQFPQPSVKIYAGSFRSWIWGWRIDCPPRSVCFRAVSGRLLPC